MQSYKSERQRQLDNVQKELLTNYYLQKYNSIMSGLSTQPENRKKVEVNARPKEPESRSQRMNFKNMILMKKNENQNSVKRTPKISNPQPQPSKMGNLQVVHKYSSREQQQNQKTIKKLEQSIINQLYRPSPSKLEQGSYNRLEISNSYHKNNESANRKLELELVPQENIEITYEQEHSINEFYEDEEEQQRVDKVKQAIKLEFERRKEHSFSPYKNSRKNSDAKSSRISAEIKIDSPRKLEKAATPNKYKKSKHRERSGKNSNMHISDSSNDSQDHEENLQRQRFQSLSSQKKSHQIYFSEDVPHTLHDYIHDAPSYDQIKQEQIEFVPPSSNYYKSQNLNLVEESFKYQEQIRQSKDHDSQKAHSVVSSRRSSRDKKLLRNDSKKSIRSRKKSELKDNSRMEMSFVSKMSMLSSNEGLLIKERIERQLYDNQLGPYQSTLYNVTELMEKYPKSGAIYAVGQKTLDDRRAFEQRRTNQESEIAQLKRNIDRIKRRSQVKAVEREQQAIMGNKLQILRLIRKISTTL